MAAIVVVWALACGLAGPARVAVAAKAKTGASPEAEGRKHARKANQLADINKCKLAIPEYGKALRLLKGKDPTLLFNRAECYRRIGDSPKAVADYRQFLIELPAAPNRAQVESQIAALAKPAHAPASAPSAVAAAPAPAAVAPLERLPGARAGKPGDVPAHGHDKPSLPLSEEGSLPAQPQAPAPAPAPAPALAEIEAPMALVDTNPRPDPAADTEHGSSYWWIWVVGAVVVAGGAVGAYVALNRGKTDIPTSALGNYKF